MLLADLLLAPSIDKLGVVMSGARFHWAVSLAACVAAAASAAQDADWGCWYAGGHQVQCVMLQAASDSGVEMPSSASASGGLQTIQGGDVQLYGQIVRIPLMSEPDDEVLLHQLARHTVCGASAACRMTFVKTPQEIVMLQEQAAAMR